MVKEPDVMTVNKFMRFDRKLLELEEVNTHKVNVIGLSMNVVGPVFTE